MSGESLRDVLLQRRAELEQEERERQADVERQDREAVMRRLEAVKADKARQQQDLDARLDEQLEPIKERERNQWLATHPDQTPDNFERKAWPYIRKNLIADHQAMLVKMAEERLHRSGKYTL